jgi:hypothetical protein
MSSHRTRPLCTVEFSRRDIECVRIGKKGHVFVQKRNWFIYGLAAVSDPTGRGRATAPLMI